MPKSILIVDDEAHIRFFLKLVVKEIGIVHCFEAETGQEAIDLFDDIRPDMVLMDVNMPIRTGIEALEAILDIEPDAVVVMMSSVAKRQVVEQAADLGATQYIRKDSSREEMVTLLGNIIEDIWGGNEEAYSNAS